MMKTVKLTAQLIFNFFYLLLIFFALSKSSFSQQITGLSGWNIYLDTGHSQNENVGIYGFSEAKKNLRVGLNLRQMLLEWTDIDTVYICRDNDLVSIDLSARTDHANTVGASHFHSIHSDAAAMGSSVNSTLIMWGQIGIGGPEKTPYGGKKMSDIMIGLLTAGMRTNTRGSIGDRDFYYSINPNTANNPWPYLHVNRETSMASELSEAGFHTNPIQNQLNMNESWNRLEAKSFFWSILKYHDIPRPFAGTAAGVVKDLESGLAINGAVVTLNGENYTTDTWQTLFYKYTNDQNLLRNGFYYFENVPAGIYPLQVTAQGYEPFSYDISILDTFFTFKDINLISTVPPAIVSISPSQNDSIYPGVENLIINFSRPMNKVSVEANLNISPSDSISFVWTNSDKSCTINTSKLSFGTQYEFTILGSAEDKYSHFLDGDRDGIGGDSYTFYIKTRAQDLTAPSISNLYPSEDAVNVELKPIIAISFDEPLKTSTISSRIKVIRNSTQTSTPGILRYYPFESQSVINYFITTPLFENESYTVKLLPGIEDIFGNSVAEENYFEFTTGNSSYNTDLMIDNFESGITAWLAPTASGNTIGVIRDSTKINSSGAILNHNTGSTKSMMMQYLFDTNASNWLIREYRTSTVPAFDASKLLQVFVFGDGTNNKFRFALRETSTNSFEVSPWYDLNWIGWRLVTWDLNQGQTGIWVGNGVLEPPFIFDSFQLTYNAGLKSGGTIYFDDLRIASFHPTDIKEEIGILPSKYSMAQNFPNPFNPSTQIKFSVPEESNVKIIVSDFLGREISVLFNQKLSAGNYMVQFNAASLSSGIYFYTLLTDSHKISRKMLLVK